MLPKHTACHPYMHVCMQVLRRGAKANGNGRHLPPTFKLACVVRRGDLVHDHDDDDDHEMLLGSHGGGGASAPSGLSGSGSSSLRKMKQALVTLHALVSPPLLSYTLPLAVAWVGLCGGWYCTVLWLPR